MVLDTLADQLFQRSWNRCGTCQSDRTCDYHKGYEAGLNALIRRIDQELQLLGWEPLDG